MSDAHECIERFRKGKRLSPCHNAVLVDSPDGPICSGEGCYKVVEGSVFIYIKNAPVPVKSFIEPKEIDIETPESPVLDAYEPGLDKELFPELHTVKSEVSTNPDDIVKPRNMAGMPERYRDPKNKRFL